MSNKSTMYPRQPKPGIKQLGKLDKERKERDAKAAKANERIAGICEIFRSHHGKVGHVPVLLFDKLDYHNLNWIPFIMAVACIYCNLTTEYDRQNERILFLRNPATPPT